MGKTVIKPGSTPMVRHEIEYQPPGRITLIPADMEALFVLYAYDPDSRFMNVRYVGYADNRGGNDIRTLLEQQYRINGRQWSHFSVYELREAFRYDDDPAVDALFRHVYRDDSHMKSRLTGSGRDATRDNPFVPRQLFLSFINRITRTAAKFTDTRITPRE